jgi:hypothetical protein
LAINIWKLLTSYNITALIREEAVSFNKMANSIWRLVIPYLTNEGLKELNSIDRISKISKGSEINETLTVLDNLN